MGGSGVEGWVKDGEREGGKRWVRRQRGGKREKEEVVREVKERCA